MDSVPSATPSLVTAHVSVLKKGYGLIISTFHANPHECQMNVILARRNGLVVCECLCLKSVMYCASYASSTLLFEETPTEMVNRKYFGEDQTPDSKNTHTPVLLYSIAEFANLIGQFHLEGYFLLGKSELSPHPHPQHIPRVVVLWPFDNLL